MTHVLDLHDYDAVTRRSWPWAGGLVAIERFDRVAWSWFDRNPACFATEVVEQSWEDVLVRGAPPWVEHPDAPAVAARVREHLETRQDGRSTWICVDVAAKLVEQWWLDDAPVRYLELDGLDPAGAVGLGPLQPLHLLVAPGRHVLRARLRHADDRVVTFATTFEIARGQRLDLRAG